MMWSRLLTARETEFQAPDITWIYIINPESLAGRRKLLHGENNVEETKHAMIRLG